MGVLLSHVLFTFHVSFSLNTSNMNPSLYKGNQVQNMLINKQDLDCMAVALKEIIDGSYKIVDNFC